MASVGNSQPRFQGIRTLGKGAHGFVQLVVDHTREDQQVAIKYIPRGETASFYKYVLREVLHHQQLSLCKHPHIVEFHEVFLTPRYLGVVMEYIDGQDLQAYLVKAGGTLTEDVARFVFQQLVVAVDFIHKKGKVNRDIKLANVLVVDSGNLPLVKLCDFGFSKDKFDDSAPQTQIGTALFTAPEVFLNVQGHVYEGEAVDVWSCGVVLHMLLFGCHPFLSPADMALSQAEQMVKLIENTVKGNVQVPPSAANTPAADMLCRILVPSPKKRYGIKDILAHPWFQTKLPPGALELNSAYLPAVNYQNARQSPETIKQIIKSAIQVIGPDGKPTSGPAPSSTSSMDWPDSPTRTKEDEIQQQQQQQHGGLQNQLQKMSSVGPQSSRQQAMSGVQEGSQPWQQQQAVAQLSRPPQWPQQQGSASQPPMHHSLPPLQQQVSGRHVITSEMPVQAAPQNLPASYQQQQHPAHGMTRAHSATGETSAMSKSRQRAGLEGGAWHQQQQQVSAYSSSQQYPQPQAENVQSQMQQHHAADPQWQQQQQWQQPQQRQQPPQQQQQWQRPQQQQPQKQHWQQQQETPQQHWQGPAPETTANMRTPTSHPAPGCEGDDRDLMDMLQLLGDQSPRSARPSASVPAAYPMAPAASGVGVTGGSYTQPQGFPMQQQQPPAAPPAGPPGGWSNNNVHATATASAPAQASGPALNPDPEVEALMDMDMDTSGNVLFDSSLLKMIQYDSNQF